MGFSWRLTAVPIPWLLIDFDSTFVTVESLELMGEITLRDLPAADRDGRLAAIRDLTARAMAGKLAFADALARRFELLEPRAEQLPALVEALKVRVSPSFRRHAGFLRRHADRIYIVSAGFHEVVAPVVADYGIAPDHVLANPFVRREDGRLGFDPAYPLAADGGKVAVVKSLGLDGAAVAIGDGMSDLELGTSAVCHDFLAYTETVERPEVTRKARRIAADFDAVLAALGIGGRST